MSNDVQIIEQKSDITPVDEAETVAAAIVAPFIEAAEARETEEKELKELQNAAFEAEKAIAAYRVARLAFVRKHTEFPKGELLDKDPSPLHESLALYIGDKTGHHVDGTVVKIVQLTLALHGEHQASNEWKAKKAAIDSAKAAEKAKAKQKTTARVETQVAKKVDKIGEALDAGITMLKAGVTLPDDVMAGLRATAEARGIVLPGDEPEAEEAKPEIKAEEKPAKPQRSSRAAKAAKV